MIHQRSYHNPSIERKKLAIPSSAQGRYQKRVAPDAALQGHRPTGPVALEIPEPAHGDENPLPRNSAGPYRHVRRYLHHCGETITSSI